MKNLKNISTAILAVILFAASASAQSSKLDKTETNFSVKFVGIEDNYLCFQVDIADSYNKVASLKISDRNEGELYSNNVKIDAKTLNFRIEKKEGQELDFQLLSGGKLFSKTFSTNTKTIEKVIVQENEVAVL